MFLEGILTPWYVSIPNADLDPTWPGAMVGLMPIFGREGTRVRSSSVKALGEDSHPIAQVVQC